MSAGQRISPNDSDVSEIGDEKDKKRRQRYCNVLNGASFVEVINRPGFEAFLKYIIRYGAWYNFKLNCVNAVRSGELAAIAAHKGPRRSSFDARAAAALRRETERMETHLDMAAAKLEARLEAQFDRFSASLEDRFAALERRLDSLVSSQRVATSLASLGGARS